MSEPKHIAIIMDGNGRWACERGLHRVQGHEAGARVLYDVVQYVQEFGIEWLTLFAFSSENWLRPQEEVNDLFALLYQFVETDLMRLHAENICVRIIGNRQGLDANLLSVLTHVETLTAQNTGLNLVIAFNYGARHEIVRAAQRFCQEVAEGRSKIEDLTSGRFSSYLDTHFMPDPDLIIRTSGEMRLSNFLLWQSAYAELYFLSCYWPDFTRKDLIQALEDYRSRERRYGAILT